MRAPAAAEGEALASVTALTRSAATTSNGAEGSSAQSDVVSTRTILSVPGSLALAIPASVIRTVSPALTNWPANRLHSTAALAGFEQLPTSTPRVTSRTVPPAQPRKPVVGGNVTSKRPLACAVIAPVADVLNSTT